MIEIDLNIIYQFIDNFLQDFENQSTWGMIHILMFKYWLWVLFVFIFLRFLIYPQWQLSQAIKWVSQFPAPVLLAIDVPKKNEQSIQAMENLFDHLQGFHGTFNKWEQYYHNAFQRSFSVELVSIGGNIQFLIRVPADWRNLAEAAVYSQFPDAEITEVEDYTKFIPKNYPNETHDVWGVEMSLAGNQYVPLKSYLKFEHRFSETFVDPMAALLENMSSIGPGEQIWIQYLLTPLPVDWGIKEGKVEIDKMLKRPGASPKKGLISDMLGKVSGLFSEFTEQLAGLNLSGEPVEEKKEAQPLMLSFLAPSEQEVVEGIGRKISKWAFRTKIRYLYVFEKGKGNKIIGVNGIIGAFKQWNDVNTNGLRPMLKETSPSKPQYLFKDYRREARKNIIFGAYVRRDTVVGVPGKPLCSEELASLWHFPSMYIKAPMLKTTDFTKAAAPVGLPFSESFLQPVSASKESVAAQEEATQIKPTFDYDNDEFEMQFAKDKEAFIKTRPAREKRLKEIAEEEAVQLKKIAKKEQQSVSQSSDEKKGVSPNNLPFID